MKPIGTITNYFPFLKEETISVLTSVMDAASNYYDFVIRLGNKACDEDVSLELAYIASVHVNYAREINLQEKIREKYIDHPEIVMFTFPLRSGADLPLYYDAFHEAMKKAIENEPPDWMLINIQRRASIFCQTSTDFAEAAKRFQILLDRNHDLVCFEAYFHDLLSDMYNQEGDHVNAIMEAEKSLKSAKEADDVFSVMIYTGFLAMLLRNYNTNAALEHLEKYNRLGILFGIPYFMNIARNYMGIIYLILGEYDMALECQIAALEVYYADKEPSDTLSSVISTIHCDLGDGVQALNWSEQAFSSAGGKSTALMYYAKSRALTLLGKIEEAEHNLNLLHKLSLTSAVESDTAWYLHARGLHEFASGMAMAAINTLEEALSIIEPLNIQIMINRILIALTQVEVSIVDHSIKDDSSGPWMVRLESHARKKDYPGIQMHAALLRAEFFVKQGRKEEAQEVLQEALTVLDSPTVNTLRTRIQKMLNDLIVA